MAPMVARFGGGEPPTLGLSHIILHTLAVRVEIAQSILSFTDANVGGAEMPFCRLEELSRTVVQ